MCRTNLKILICLLFVSSSFYFCSADSNDVDDDEKELHDILPMAQEAVEKMLSTLRKNSAILAFLPKNAKIALARE
jgi:hypothetical protein